MSEKDKGNAPECLGWAIMEITQDAGEIESTDRWRLLSCCLALVLSQV